MVASADAYACRNEAQVDQLSEISIEEDRLDVWRAKQWILAIAKFAKDGDLSRGE